MARVFSITAAATGLRTDAQGRGEASFTITNVSGKPLRGRFEIRASTASQQSWLSVTGESEREFGPNATQQVVVQVAVPPGAPPGPCAFRLDAVSSQNPDDDFAEGPTVTFEVTPQAPAKKPFPWWIVAVAAAVVLVAGGITTYLLTRHPATPQPVTQAAPVPVKVPALVGTKVDAARRALLEAGLKVGPETSRLIEHGTAGDVVSTDPAAGVPVDAGTEVRLETAQPAVKVPDVVGKPREQAEQAIKDTGLQVAGPFLVEATTQAENNTVKVQTPAAGTLVPAIGSVELHVSQFIIKGSEVPNVVGATQADAEARIKAARLSVGAVERRLTDGAAAGTVLDQTPKGQAGAVVVEGSAVQLVVADVGVKVPTIIGFNLTAARNTLRSASLEMREAYVSTFDGTSQDTVLGQNPPAGALAKPGAAVDVNVANAMANVPNVVGNNRGDAVSRLSQARLTIAESRRDVTSGTQDAVLEQKPGAGTIVKAGSSVSLVLANIMISVPKVVGFKRSDAVNTLGGQKLAVKEIRRNAANTPQDSVLDQDPKAGVTVKPGTAVSIVIADAVCTSTRVELGNDHVFILIDLPETKAGGTYRWNDAGVAKYVFPRCYRVAIEGYSYACNATPGGASWAQGGKVIRDALCGGSGSTNQAYMRSEER